MLGEKVSAQQLHKWGVINSITDPGQAFNKALELAERLNQRAPNSLASIKELLNESQELHLNQHLRQERDQFVKNLHHPNSGIGIQAFFDKTKPNYKE
jgi:enoyl-CoA hydratase/carnithine racemase